MPAKNDPTPLSRDLQEGVKGASDAFGWGAGKHDPQLAALVTLVQKSEEVGVLLAQWLKVIHEENARQGELLKALLQHVQQLEARLEQQPPQNELTQALLNAMQPRIFP